MVLVPDGAVFGDKVVFTMPDGEERRRGARVPQGKAPGQYFAVPLEEEVEKEADHGAFVRGDAPMEGVAVECNGLPGTDASAQVETLDGSDAPAEGDDIV